MFDHPCLGNITEITLSGNAIKRDDELYLRIVRFDDKCIYIYHHYFPLFNLLQL